MKRLKLFIGLIAAMAVGQGAIAQTVFSYSGIIETYTVPAGVTMIQIECIGAQGGYTNGGLGATITGDFAVTPGQVLEILVGGQGATNGSTSNDGGSGGGGSFVVDQATVTAMCVAGGGGGGCDGSTFESSYSTPYDAATTNAQVGEDGATTTGGTGGGTAGSGADCGLTDCCLTGGQGGSGGGGFLTDGTPGSAGDGSGIATEGGFAFVNGGAGGIAGMVSSSYPTPTGGGGFGGGGGSTMDNAFRAGGGGGYSGGQGAAYISSASGYIWGGGGGSFNSGSSTSSSVTNTGDGQITITELCNGLITTVSDDTVCVGDEVTLSAASSGSGVVTWDGGVVDGVPFTPPAGSTTYNATSDDPADCGFSVTIFVGDLPTVDAGTDVTFCPGDSVMLTAAGTATDWSWDGGIVDATNFLPPSGTTTYTLTGTIDSTGCMSTDMVDVAEVIIDNSVTATGSDLMSNQAGATYQWLDCPALTPVAGETSQTYASVPEGEFAVEITLDGCVDTSACQLVHLGITDGNLPFEVYPNPTEGQFQIKFSGEFDYTVNSMLGEVILSGKGIDQEILDLYQQASGPYILTIRTSTEEYVVQIIKK